MDYVGIDVHKKENQLCILSEGGELVEQPIRTTPERFAGESMLVCAAGTATEALA